MGGLGSGYAGGRKLCVEECFSLNVDRLRAHGAIPRWGTWQATAGAWGWTAETGERLASVGYEVRAIDDEFLFLTLRYWAHGDPVEQGIWLDATPAHFGGHRWWFMCPLWVRGVPCWRHVGRLYLPPGGEVLWLPALLRPDIQECPAGPRV